MTIARLIIKGVRGYTPTTGSWTVPEGVTQINVQCWGGGGSINPSQTTTAGGGGGGYSEVIGLSVTPGQTFQYSVANGPANYAGSPTRFYLTTENAGLIASGGGSGTYDAGGAGGSAVSAGVDISNLGYISKVSYAGGAGRKNSSSFYGGGGGSSATKNGNGVGGSTAQSGANALGGGEGASIAGLPGVSNPKGGGGGWGAGAPASGYAGAATYGGSPGGGSGGKALNTVDTHVTGGGVGQLIIEWTIPDNQANPNKSLLVDAILPNTSSTGTWVVPEGVTKIDVELWGAGGGNNSTSTYTGGGGGGGYSKVTGLTVSQGEEWQYFVATGTNSIDKNHSYFYKASLAQNTGLTAGGGARHTTTNRFYGGAGGVSFSAGSYLITAGYDSLLSRAGGRGADASTGVHGGGGGAAATPTNAGMSTYVTQREGRSTTNGGLGATSYLEVGENNVNGGGGGYGGGSLYGGDSANGVVYGLPTAGGHPGGGAGGNGVIAFAGATSGGGQLIISWSVGSSPYDTTRMFLIF